MQAIDLHTHTRFFHGYEGRATKFDPIGANLLALWGRWRDLDGITLTNHDYYSEFTTVAPPPTFLPGIEITSTDGHALVVGPDPPVRTPPGELTPGEVVSLAHDSDCAAIIAHPFRRSSLREDAAAFDAVEPNGKHPGEIVRVQELARKFDLPVVGGSDAHYPFEVGRAYTEMDIASITPKSVVSAIRAGNVTAKVRESFGDTVTRRAYRLIHSLR